MTKLKYIPIIALLLSVSVDQCFAWNFDDEVRGRVESLDLSVTPQLTKRVKQELHVYLNLDNSHTEEILGRMVQYFPMIERKLREHGLPHDLKYIVVAESRIDPLAVSGDGAVGLWQLMPATARELGLRIDDDVDERRDPEKATDAAISYLRMLHGKLDNWELVMAAYNGGYVRINRAIKKAGKPSLRAIKKYLPRETAEFKDRIVAAAYLCQYYHRHFFTTPEINLDLQIIEKVKMYTHTRIIDIAQRTGLPAYVIHQLNPMYRKHYIPASERGLDLILPKRVADQFKSGHFILMSEEDKMIYNPNVQYRKFIYIAELNETVYSIAKINRSDPFLIKYWNKIEKLVVDRPRELTLYQVK